MIPKSMKIGRHRYTIYNTGASYRQEPGTDFEALEEGMISITPMHFDLTDIAGMDHLERLSLADALRVAGGEEA